MKPIELSHSLEDILDFVDWLCGIAVDSEMDVNGKALMVDVRTLVRVTASMAKPVGKSIPIPVKPSGKYKS